MRISRLLLVVVAAAMVQGCAFTRAPRSTVMLNYPHSTEETLTDSSYEHFHRLSQVAERDARVLIEDLDYLFLAERPSRLSRWHDR